MEQQPYDWRDEPRRFSVSSLVLLAIFVAAVAITVYIAFDMEPWASEEAVETLGAETAGEVVAPGEQPAAPPAEQPVPPPEAAPAPPAP